MKQKPAWFLSRYVALLLILSAMITSCGGVESTLALDVRPATEVQVGKEVAIVASVKPPDVVNLKWSITSASTAKGTLNPDTGENVVFTATKEGTAFIVAEGTTASGQPVKQTVTLTVVSQVREAAAVPPPTDTPLPVIPPTPTPLPVTPPPTPTPLASPITNTPTPTMTPSLTLTPTTGLVCRLAIRACITHTSPQLAQVSSAVLFIFPIDQPGFTAEYSDEDVHSAPFAIKLVYDAAQRDFGGWGIGGLPGYDIRQFARVSFFLKGTAIGQTFEFKLKDLEGHEDTVQVTVNTLDWTEVTFALDRTNFPTVNFAELENVNIGFNNSLGSATIYVDDFTFR